MNARAAVALALIGFIAGCEGSKPNKPAGMPEGYAPVNAAFGVRIGGLVDVDGEQQAPVVEFRANGDYAMYPLRTNCEGSFQRLAGLVFAADGTVREQIKEHSVEILTASPHFSVVIDEICKPSRTMLAAIKDDAKNHRTRFGLVSIVSGQASQVITFNKETVATGSSLKFVNAQRLRDADLLLVHEEAIEQSCGGGGYFVLAVREAEATASQSFGTCVEGQPVVRVDGDALSITLPSAEGPVEYRYINGDIEAVDTNSGSGEVELEAFEPQDAEANAVDAAAAAAESAAAAADAASDAADAASVGGAAAADNELSRRWAASCLPVSRRIITPAGSTVGLSPPEAGKYCACIFARAPSEAAALIRKDALRDEPLSALMPQAHAICLGELM